MDIDTAAAPRAIAGALYLGPDNAIRATAFNSAAGVELTIAGQILSDEGRVVDFSFSFTPTTARAMSTSTQRLGCGWLLNVQIFASAGTPRRGQCFVRLAIVQGFTGAIVSLGTLLQGYVQDTTALAYPGSPIEASTEGPGVIRSIAGTDPAAGAEISEAVPTNARWRLLSLRASLVTDGTVANRFPRLIVDDGTTVLFSSEVTPAQAASQTSQNQWAAWGVGQYSGQALAYSPLPPRLLLMGGYRLLTLVTNLQAGDNWGAPQLLVEEWIED